MRIILAAFLAATLATPAAAWYGGTDNGGNQHVGAASASGSSGSGRDIVSYSRAKHKDLARLKSMARLSTAGGSVGQTTCQCSTGGFTDPF